MADLERARKRAIACILEYKESFADVHLPEQVAAKLRQVIVNEVNRLHDTAAEAAEPDDTWIHNDLFYEKLEQIYAVVVGDG